jgi:hypothetical protein
MVESSDLQSAIQRTQAMERLQQLQNQQEELNRKRFELELARQRAEKRRKVTDAERTEHKRIDRDRYDGAPDHEKSDQNPSGDEGRGEPGDDSFPETGGNIDVRV